ITDALLQNIKEHDFFVVNFANADMVGHTGNLKATIKAMEAMDKEMPGHAHHNAASRDPYGQRNGRP
ncbi:MAG: hypothetical protein AABZ23_03970, partial [Deltaproteobacteria bacterium]